MKKRILFLLIAVCVAVCLMAAPGTTCADEIHVDDLLTDAVPYNGETVLQGTYSVSGTVTVSDRITVNGTVNLILVGDCALRANAGIELVGKNALNVYAKKDDSGVLGMLEATAADDGDAGIGIGHCETSPMNGGKLTVYDGVILATGKVGGAGIGGGAGADGIAGGNGCTVFVKGGYVTGVGGEQGIGIGGGRGGQGASGGIGGKLQINEGVMTGIAGEHGFAIGGGLAGDGYTGDDARGSNPAVSFSPIATLKAGLSEQELEEVEKPDFGAVVFRAISGHSYLDNETCGSVLSGGSLTIVLVIVVAAVAAIAILIVLKKRKKTASVQ